jgi:epoxyqueuosine reductase
MLHEYLEKFRSALERHDLSFAGHVDLDLGPAFEAYKKLVFGQDIGTMDYLRIHADLRAHPQKLLENAQSALIVALPYRLEKRQKGMSRIARYAQLPDYHKLIKARLLKIFDDCPPPFSYRICVDSAPVLERFLASKAPGAALSKNTMYIHPQYGSFVLLGCVLTDAPCEPQPAIFKPHTNCSTCRRCQVHCPTGALKEDFTIEATRCLSYWTIENRDTIPEAFWSGVATHIFGCDKCQDVCPINRQAQTAQWHQTQNVVAETIDPFVLATLDHATYLKLFAGTALTRAKIHGLRRNGLIALAVTKDPRLSDALATVDKTSNEMLQKTKKQILGRLTFP